MPGLTERAKTLTELAESAAIYVRPRPLSINDKAAKLLDKGGREVLAAAQESLSELNPWSAEALESWARDYTETADIKLGALAQPLRAALTGTTVSPPIFDVMAIFGREEALARIAETAKTP